MRATSHTLYELPASSRRERDRLEGVVDALLTAERLAVLRTFFVAVVVALAVPLFVVAAWPRLLPEGVRAFLLLCDAGSLVGLALTALAGWRAATRVRRNVGQPLH